MENKIEVQGQDSAEESRGSGWDSMGDWSETHPFELNQNSEPSDEENEDDHEDDDFEEVRRDGLKTEQQSRLAEIRQKHIEYLEGKYDPTPDERDRFSSDEGFYKSEQYKKYKEGKFEEIKDKYADVFNPSDESIKFTLMPFLWSVEEDIDKLMGFGVKMEKGGYNERDVKRIVLFFAEKFGLPNIPGIELVGDGSGSKEKARGRYDRANGVVTVLIDRTRSAADLIHIIAHEMWHVYQYLHEADEEKYDINFSYYRESSVDQNAYRNQLVEKEAFFIGDAVGELYRLVDLEEHPEKIPELNEKYRQYCSGEYDPNKTEDGIDLEYLVLAYDEYEQYVREGLKGNTRKILELNDEYERWVSRDDPSEVWKGTDYRVLEIAHEEYKKLNYGSGKGRKKGATGIFKRLFRREKK